MKTKFNGFLTLFLALVVQISFAQNRTISGVVSDESGPLPGVSVSKKGTTQGTETDFDGKYSIQAKTGDVLVFSFVGMDNVEKTVGMSNRIEVSMTSGNVLDEVIVTALGISKEKKKLGYAVSNVSAEQIEKSVANDVAGALSGQVTGVQFNKANGVGGSTNVVIRGASSMTGNNQALFVVDGVPISNDTFNEGVAGVNRANDIDPANIKSVSVLKGGAATVLYGERAANGVVVIETKQGSLNSKLKTTLTSSYLTGSVMHLPEFQTSYARGSFGKNNAFTHWNWGPAYGNNPKFVSNSSIDLDADGVKEDVSGKKIPYYDNNYERFWKREENTKLGLSFTGGTEKTSFFASVNRLDGEGITRNSSNDRTSLLINTKYFPNDNFTVGVSANYINSNKIEGPVGFGTNGAGTGLAYWQHMWDIDRPWKDSNDKPTWFSTAVADPNWILYETPEYSSIDRILGNFNMSYKISNWLNVAGKVGLDQFVDNRKRIQPIYTRGSAGPRKGEMYQIKAVNKDLTFDFLLSGDVNLSEDIELSYLLGTSVFESQYERLTVEGKEQVVKGFNEIQNFKTLTSSNRIENYRLIGLFGEATFNYKNFLFLGGTVRTDWSSTLSPKNRNFTYPSANIGFIFSNLLEDKGVLSFGKLRASWAQLGKSAPIYSLYDVYSKADDTGNRGTANAPGDNPRFTVDKRARNIDLKPEISSEWEVGTNLRFFGNKIDLDFTYYDKKSEGQHVYVPLDNATGYEEYITNAGIVKNSGVEASLVLKNLFDLGEFNWELGANFTKNKSFVETIPDGLEKVIVAEGWGTSAEIVAVPNKSAGMIYGYDWKKNDKGQLLLDDKGYPQKSNKKTEIGNILPDWIMNLNGKFEYKNFNLGFLLEIKEGGDMVNESDSWLTYSGKAKRTEDRFYGANDKFANSTKVWNGIIESTGEKSTIASQLTNNFWSFTYSGVDAEYVEDASWVRLKSVSLGYSLPKKALENIFVDSLDFTVIGTNLWLQTDYSGNDPGSSLIGASNRQGLDFFNTPSTRSFSFNVKVGF